MKKMLVLFMILCLLTGIFISVASVRPAYAVEKDTMKSETADESQLQAKTVIKAAGMDVHVPATKKHHSIDAYIHIPYSEKKFNPIKIHLDKDRKTVVSGFSREIIVVEHDGFKFKIRNAVFNKKMNMFTGDAKITGHYLPGYVYAHYIAFNENGIQKIEDLEHRDSWKIAGFNFSPQALKWKNGAIEAKGLLEMKTLTAETTADFGRNGITNILLNEEVFCKINNHPVTIDKITLKENRLYVSGFSDRHTPNNPFRFKDVSVGADGKINVKLPSPPKSPAPHELSNYKPSSGFTFQDMGNLLAGMSGLPGELLVKVANSSMTMRVTSVQKEGDKEFYSGYVTLPEPLGRANITRSAKSGSAAALNSAEMHWQKEKITVPIINCELTTVDDVKFKEKTIQYGDDKVTSGCLVSPMLGILKILEISPDAASIFTDGSWINYTVNPYKLNSTFKAGKGNISPLMSTGDNKITFIVRQRQNDIGFYFDDTCSSMSLAPTNSWFSSANAEQPHLTFDFRSTGYIYFFLETGKECKIPIIPELLEIENPTVKFLRYPNFFTEFWIEADFINPETESIFRVVGSFYLDVNGMSSVSGIGKLDTGSELEFQLFKKTVGKVSFDFDGNKKIFTCDGDLEVMGHSLFDNKFQLYLKKSADYLLKGYATITITVYVPYWKKPFYKKIHKNISIKYHIKRNGTFGLSFGKYNFHGHHGGGDPSYDGLFTADGVSYNGHMELKAGSDITLNGKTDDMKSSAGNDSVDTTLSIDGTMDDTGNVDSGTITTTSMSLTLKPTIPQSQNPVEIDINLTPSYTKDLQSNQWQTPQQDVQVSFSYTDSKGNQQTYNDKCNFRVYLDQATMHIDLDLPPKYGGTYSQSFDMAGK